MSELRVFWPSNAADDTGTMIGWSHDGTVVVAAVLEDYNEQLIHASSKWLELQEGCKHTPRVLGTTSLSTSRQRSLVFDDTSYNSSSPAYITYRHSSLPFMRFYSLLPLELDITSNQLHGNALSHSSQTTQDLLALDCRAPTKFCDLHLLIRQVNASSVVQDILGQKTHAHRPLHIPPVPSPLKTLAGVVVSSISTFCELPIPLLNSRTRLKDVSTTIQQIDVRLEQFSVFLYQIHLIHGRSRKDILLFSAQYINFYNNVWLILNDVILGSAVAAFLSEHNHYLAAILHRQCKRIFIDAFITTLIWLDNWPVGLKLNTQLSSAICYSFSTLTLYWSAVLDLVQPFLPTIIYLLGLSGNLGLTMMLSLASDGLTLLTLHIYFGYLVATWVCRRLITTIGSLWNLFRGKRYNVLRERLDSWDYTVDQLLLGTILFTLLTFLAPTIIVYYMLFAVFRLALISGHAVLETCLALLNHFPLFVLMLRLKDPGRLPGGVCFVPESEGEQVPMTLSLQSVPIPVSKIFFQHILLLSRIAAHYNPLRLLRCIMSATFIIPIPRYSIRYSMVPTQQDNVKRFKQD